MTDGIPSLEPLAPIVDRMREIATDELPEPRTCRIRMWDDGTFDASITHSMAEGEAQLIRYERTTSEITWEHHTGARWEETALTGGETIHEPTFDDSTVRVVETIDPPY